jgi:hypothetical protein
MGQTLLFSDDFSYGAKFLTRIGVLARSFPHSKIHMLINVVLSQSCLSRRQVFGSVAECVRSARLTGVIIHSKLGWYIFKSYPFRRVLGQKD